MAVIDTGTNTAGKANVDANFNLQVNTPGYTATGTAQGGGPANAGSVAIFSENDPGVVTGARDVASPETDEDYRLRGSLDTNLDNETFNYTAQNTGKHNYLNSVLTNAWTVQGLQTNSGSSTAIGGTRVRTYAYFPIIGVTQTYVEFTGSFSSSLAPSNTTVDIGMFLDGGATPFQPTDGAYFRSDPAGFFGVIVNNGGAETSVALTGFAPTANQKHKFTIAITERRTQFWIDDILYGTITTPSAVGQPFTAASLPFAMRHAIVTAVAGAVYQVTLSDMNMSVGGPQYPSSLAEVGNRMYGAHQGLSGGTMGSLASYANNTTPAGAAGSNTAALVTGLGGQANLNAPATAATDLILTSYQVPAGTISVQGRRLALRGVRIGATNLGAAVATTETALLYTLNFGHTAVSLATAEGAAAKAPRREALGMLSWAVGAAVGAPPREGSIFMQFMEPIYVNPSEFIAIACKPLVGTATAAETFMHSVVFDYGWE